MRIMLGSDTYPPNVNGAARFTERLAIGLAGRGHEVHLVAPSPKGKAYVEDRDDVIVHRITSHRYPLVKSFQICMPWEASPEIERVMREVRPDVAHTQAHFLVGRFLALHADRQDVPLVATNHFMPENLVDHVRIPQLARDAVARAAWRDLRWVFKRAQVVTAPTPRAVELLDRAAGLPGGLAISCGIDAQPYADAAARAHHDDVPTVLFVGRLDQEKRVNELIEAFAQLPADVAARLEIVGDGAHAASWKELVEKVGIADRTRFLGFISEAELLEAYGRCDVFCMPGVAELQSLVTLESMAAGKPVVAADAMALPHLVHPGENGFLFTPGDVVGLAGHLETLLRDPDLRARMGKVSQEIVSRHALKATLDRFEGLYEGVVAARGAEGQRAA